MNCPCNSGKSYNECCQHFISGKQLPQTPEQLMRSRYTAFTQANIDYIQQTMIGAALKNFDAKQTALWAKQANWLGLMVVKAKPGEIADKQGFVEFIARFREQGTLQKIHELSEFHCIDGRWFYVNGRHL